MIKPRLKESRTILFTIITPANYDETVEQRVFVVQIRISRANLRRDQPIHYHQTVESTSPRSISPTEVGALRGSYTLAQVHSSVHIYNVTLLYVLHQQEVVVKQVLALSPGMEVRTERSYDQLEKAQR